MSNPSKEAAAVNCLPPAPKKSAALTGIAAQLAPVQLLSPAPLTQAAPVPVYKIKVPRKAVKEVRLQDADLVLVLEGNDTHLIKNAARRYAAHKPFSLQFTDAKVAGGKFIDNLLQAMGNSQANIASDSSTAFSDLAVLPPALDGAAAGGSVPGTLVPVHIHTRNEANPDTVASAAANTEAGTATNASAAAWAEVAAPLPVATAAMPPQAAPSNDRPWGLLALLAALGLAAGSAKSGSGSGSGSDSGNGSNTNTPASSGNPAASGNPGGTGNPSNPTGSGSTGGTGSATDTVSTNTNTGTPPPPSNPSTLGTTLQVTPVEGPFLPAVPLLYQVYDSTHQLLLGTTGTAGSQLVLPASLASGWVLVQVSQTNDSATQTYPDYQDEYSRTGQTLDAPLRAWVHVTQGARTAASVTPLTELAVRLLEQAVQQGTAVLNADSMAQYNAQVASLFGLSDALTSPVEPLVDVSGNTLPGNAYGQVLQALSALASVRSFGSPATTLAWLTKEIGAASSDALPGQAAQRIARGYLAEAEKLLDDQHLLTHAFSRSRLDAPLQFSIHQAEVQTGAAQLSDGSSNAQPNALLAFADARLAPAEISASATLLLPVPLSPQSLAGDVLTLTLHGLQADSSLPQQTLHYSLQSSDALNNYASIPLAEVPAAWWSAAMGQRIGITAQLSTAALPDGLATGAALSSAAYSVLPSGVLVSNRAATPVLQAGLGVADGATAAEASQASGIFLLTADTGASISLTFSDGTRTIGKTLIGQGSPQAIVLDAWDIGMADNQLHDGSISVVAIASNRDGPASSPAAASFTLDTQAPVVQRLVAEASKTDGTPLIAGDVLFFTIGFDEVVVGAAVAPTLTIGLETGIALTPLVSTGNSRSWSYTVSTSGIQPDQGAVSLVLDTHANGMGDAPSGLGDAAGNALDAAPGTLVLPTAFSVDTRTPAAPVLAVGAGVANGATAAEATQASGILDFSAAAGSSVTLQLVDGSGHSIHKTFSASGSAQAVVLEASDIGSAANQLHDGPIAVFAQATHAAGTSSASLLSLQLDSVAPQLQSAVLSSSRSNGSAAAMGDELTYTLSYDSQVFGAPGAPTLTIGLEAGIAMTPVIASGASRSWRYVLGSSGRPDSGAIAVVDGNYLSGIRDAAGNQAVDATASNGSHGGGGSSGESIPPEAPILTLGQGVADGASALEAVQASGVMLLTAPAGNTVHVRFSDGLQSVTQTVLATGSAQPLVLGAADVGLSLTALHDGPIAVWAVASNAAGLSSSASLSSFTLDSTGPQLLGVVISAAKSANTPLVAGDVLTISANYDEAVFGTPTAPTLGIGSETGITLTPLVTEGSQRSWTYALSASGTPDNGAITLEGGNFTTALHDAAGNPAFHADSDAPAFTGFYSANSNTPAAPELRLASGVAPAASAAKATATSGVLTFTAEAQSTVVVAFSDGQHSLQKTLQATGSEQAVVLVASDLGSGPQQLQDGNIRVSATAHNAAGPSVSSNALLFLLDTSAPASTPSGLAFSSDTAANGSSNSDRVTRTATQTISASLSAALASGETLQASLDGGAHWSDISTFVSGQRLDWSGVNLLAGANSLLLQVVDQAGNAGSVLNQPYELDSLTPSTVISAAALSADTAVNAGSNSDFITNSAAQSISANLTAPLGSAEMLYGSLDGGANWTDISGFVSGQSLTWSGQSLTASNTLLLKVSDAAGNDGAVFSQPYVLDRSAPTTSVSSVGLLRDTGSSSSDLVTSEASQIVHGQLAAPLRAGETVQVSVDGGTSWQQASATVGTTLYSLAGATLPQASLPDGSNSLQVKLSDAAGNDGPVFSQPYVLDRSAPAVPQLNLGSDIRDGANAAEATASSGVLDIRAEAGSSLLLTLSDGNRSIRRSLVATGAAQPVVLQASDIDGPNALQQGSISVTASATDSAGNVSSTVSSSFFLDNQPPGAAALFLGDGVANGATAAEASASSGVVQLRAEAGNRVVVTFSVDGHSHSVTRSLLATGALQAVTLDAADVGSAANQLPDGSILVTALARNAAGNVSSTTQVRFVLDTSAPGSSVNALQLGNDSGSSNSDFMTRVAEQSISASLGTAPAEGETLYGSVDGGSHWTDLTPYLQGSTLRWSGITLLDGPHTLLVKRTDLAGNDGPITRQDYVLDRSAPAAPVLQLGSGVADGATLAEAMQASGVLLVSAEPGSQVTVDFGSGIGVSKTLVGTGAAQAVTLDAADLVFAEANRLHWPIQVLVTVRDVAGNSSTDSSSWLLDANPPQASILIPAAVQNGGASLAEASAASGAFSVSSESGASVLLTLSDGTRTLSQSWVSDGSAHAVSLDAAAGGSQAGPLQDGTIHITAVATDPAGNSGNPVRASFTLDSVAPTAQVRSQTGLPTSLTGNRGAVLAQPASTIGGDVTIETWFYTDPSPFASNKLFGLDESIEGHRFYLAYDSSANQFQLFNIAGDGPFQIINYSMPYASLLHSWHHLALALDSSNVATLYLDGMALGNGSLNLALPNVPRIGYAVGTGVIGGQSYNGAFADFRVYDSARSSTQIQADMASPADPYDANLKLYYLLDGNTNSGLAGSTASATRVGNGDFSFSPLRAVRLSNDSGLSGIDLVTQSASQTISASLSAHLQPGETLFGSLDGGSNWSDLTAFLTGTDLQWSGATLASAGTLQLQVSDVAGNSGPLLSHTYAVDNSAPAAPTLVIPNDLGNGGASRAEVLAPTGVVQVRGESGSLLSVTFSTFGSSNNVLVKNLIATGELQPVVLSATDIGSGAGQLKDGSINITLRSTDLAGNSSSSPSNGFILDSVNTTGVLSRPALTLDAANSAAVRLPAAAGNISGDITLEAWVYASGPTAQWARVFDIGTGQQSNNILLGFNQGKLTFQAFNGATLLGSVNAASNFSTNLWQHVAVTVNTSNGVTLYVNGASVATGSLGQAIAGLASGVRGQNYLGQSNWAGDPFFNGSFADVRVYDNARSASQIASDMAGGASNSAISSDPNLQAWYPFASDNQSGNSGAGNAGAAATLLGNPVFSSPGSLALSADTPSPIGTGSHDFNTRTASQTISGTLNANLGVGESVWVSLDSGNTWAAASASAGSSAWSLATNLLPGRNNLVVKVTDTAGNDGPVFSQPYVLDTSAPAQSFSIDALSADSAANGSLNSDFITRQTAQTVHATLSAPLATDDHLYASVNGGGSWSDVSSFVTGTSLSWPATLNTGTNTLVLKLGDQAGNPGLQLGQSYTVDSTPPLARFEDHPALTLNAASQQYASLPVAAGSIGSDITLEAWVYANGTPAQFARILDLGMGAANQNIILGFNGGKLFFQAFNNSSSLGLLQDTQAFASNTWNHVAVTVNSFNAVTLYVNGVVELTGNLSSNIPTAARSSNLVGHSNWPTDPGFNGSISDVRIYDNTRSNVQIRNDMTGAVDSSDSNLKGYYPLNNSAASGLAGGTAATTIGNPAYGQFTSLSFSADTGSSATDFITSTAEQTISAKLLGTLGAGEKVYGSLDSGSTWSDISTFLTGTTLTWSGTTLPTANISHSVQIKVSDIAGNDGPLLSQIYLLEQRPVLG